jgi:hypothetical protein
MVTEEVVFVAAYSSEFVETIDWKDSETEFLESPYWYDSVVVD